MSYTEIIEEIQELIAMYKKAEISTIDFLDSLKEIRDEYIETRA